LVALTTSVRSFGPKACGLGDQAEDAQSSQLGPQLLGGGGDQAAELVEGPDPVLAGAGAGHPQYADGLHAAVSRLGQALGAARQGCSGGLDRVERIGLAGPAPLLAVGASTSTTRMPLS